MKAVWIVWATIASSLAAFFVLAALWVVDAVGLRGFMRENAFDLMLRLEAAPDSSSIVVIDIDSESIAQFGAWPWSRSLLGRLVDKLADGQPSVIGVDMLLAGEDRYSPAAVARRLALETGRDDITAIAGELPDGDAQFARAMARAPVVLGAVLAGEAGEAFQPSAPILVRGEPRLPDIWVAVATIGPSPTFARAAAGIGLIVFDNDADGVARRTPLLAIGDGAPVAGFAVEALRVAREASTLIVEDAPARLSIGDIVAPLSPDASLRFRASAPKSWEARTVSAARVLAGRFDAAALKGKIVLVGASAPEVGLLRRTAEAEAAASVQVEADTIATLQSGAIATRPAFMAPVEAMGALLLGLAAIGVGARLRPARGVLVVVALVCGWIVAAAVAWRVGHFLLDPAGPVALAALAFVIAAITTAVVTERRERRLRSRFEQHLAPAVVARILANPGALRLAGESREVTAMFTDIEGFTSMTERAEPPELVALLDAYFQMLADIVVAHGGMVGQIIGDGVYVLFNAPLDLPDHQRRAVECAIAIRDACLVFAQSQKARALGFGRTRIGIESGPAIVGDIGGKRKLDYTAHGTAINTASRMEAANKELGTTICIGPGAAAGLAPGMVRSLGTLTIRGRSAPIEVFEPVG